MRATRRPILVWAATYLVALHAMLVVASPLSALTAPDLSLALCHSAATDNGNPAQDTPPNLCDHCVLCSLTAAAVAAGMSSGAPALMPAGYLSPLPLDILLPLRGDRSHGARAPPHLM